MRMPLILACCLIATLEGEAQGQRETIDILPTVGLFAPARDLLIITFGAGGASRTFTLGQEAGLLAGARVTAWWSKTFGWEAGFTYATSNVRLDENGTDLCQSSERACGANVWITSSRILARWAPVDASWTLHGGAGLTVVGHVGDFWEAADAVTDLGGVLGVGGTIDFSRLIGFRLDIDDHIYQFNARFDDPDLGPISLAKRWQHDVVVAATVVFRVFGT